MRFASAAARGLLAAGLLGALGGIASAQVMPPPTEPVVQRHLFSMGNPGIASREYTGGDNFLGTPWEMHRPAGSGLSLGPVPDLRPAPPPNIVIQRVPARRATVTRRTVKRARPAVE